MEQQTWVTLLGFAGFCLALMCYLASMKRDLRTDIRGVDTKIDAVRTELKTDIRGLDTKIDGVHTDLKSDLSRVDSRLITLENRTYDISARLPPAPASSTSQTA